MGEGQEVTQEVGGAQRGKWGTEDKHPPGPALSQARGSPTSCPRFHQPPPAPETGGQGSETHRHQRPRDPEKRRTPGRGSLCVLFHSPKRRDCRKGRPMPREQREATHHSSDGREAPPGPPPPQVRKGEAQGTVTHTSCQHKTKAPAATRTGHGTGCTGKRCHDPPAHRAPEGSYNA